MTPTLQMKDTSKALQLLYYRLKHVKYGYDKENKLGIEFQSSKIST